MFEPCPHWPLGLVPDPVVEKRKSPNHLATLLPSAASEGCDGSSVPASSSSHTRVTSFILLSNGEFCNITGRLDSGSVSSSPLDDVEKGLDLRGTEKGGQVLLLRLKSLTKTRRGVGVFFFWQKINSALLPPNVCEQSKIIVGSPPSRLTIHSCGTFFFTICNSTRIVLTRIA